MTDEELWNANVTTVLGDWNATSLEAFKIAFPNASPYQEPDRTAGEGQTASMSRRFAFIRRFDVTAAKDDTYPLKGAAVERKLGVQARATVTRVIDGDTLVCSIHWPVTIRLLDCWAHETRGDHKFLGLAATSHLRTLLGYPGKTCEACGHTAHTPIIVDVRTNEADSFGDILTFGRVLGQIYREGDEDSVSDMMIRDGFATRTRKELHG